MRLACSKTRFRVEGLTPLRLFSPRETVPILRSSCRASSLIPTLAFCRADLGAAIFGFEIGNDEAFIPSENRMAHPSDDLSDPA
jgi:hypothetical protein